MKTLYLVRHAKSSWKNEDLKDTERPLKKRGIKNAEFMAKLLKKNDNMPDMIASSPAARAFDTAGIFSEKFEIDKKNIFMSDKLYMADYDDFISVIKEFPENISRAMLFSHNPGLTYFACAVSGARIDNIPTCGIARIDFEINNWNAINTTKGKLIFFEFPKKYEEPEDNN